MVRERRRAERECLGAAEEVASLGARWVPHPSFLHLLQGLRFRGLNIVLGIGVMVEGSRLGASHPFSR